MGIEEVLLILSIPVLVGFALAVGWLAFKVADRTLEGERSGDFEERVLAELDALHSRVDAMIEPLEDPRRAPQDTRDGCGISNPNRSQR
jgi:hypothetical protein